MGKVSLLSFRLHLQFKWAITVYSFSHWEPLAANDFHVSLGIIVIISTRIFGSKLLQLFSSALVLGLRKKHFNFSNVLAAAGKTCKQGHKNEGHRRSPSQLSLWPKSRVSKMTTSFEDKEKKWSKTFSRTLQVHIVSKSLKKYYLNFYFKS